MILIGTDEGIYRWFQGSPWPIYHSLQDRMVVALAAQSGGRLAAADGDGRYWESRDNGLSWCEVALPTWTGGVSAMAMGETPTSVVLATKAAGLYRRELCAEGWTPMALPTALTRGPAPVVRALAASPGESPTWYAAVVGEGLWRSADGGVSWRQCPGLPPEVYAIRILAKPAGTVAVATSDGCWISGDGGQTWADRSGGLDGARHLSALEVHPTKPDVLLAGAAPVSPEEATAAPTDGLRFALYESADGGKSWSHVQRGFPDSLPHDTIADIRFNPDAPDHALVALASGEIWNTRNGGQWWEPLARQFHAARALCAV